MLHIELTNEKNNDNSAVYDNAEKTNIDSVKPDNVENKALSGTEAASEVREENTVECTKEPQIPDENESHESKKSSVNQKKPNLFKKSLLFIKSVLFGTQKPVLRTLLSACLHFISLLSIDLIFRYFYAHNDPELIASDVPFLFSIFWCIALSGFAIILPRLLRRIYIITSTLFYCILVIAHGIIDSFFGQYMSFSSLMFADEGAGFFDFSYFSIPKKFVALIILCLFVSVIAALILPKIKYRWINIAVSAALISIGIAGIANCENTYFKGEEGGIGWASVKTPSDAYDEFTDYHLNMHMCGLYQYTFRDISISSGLDDLMTKFSGKSSELNDYYASKEVDPDNEMTGIFKDKNLIVIQLESIDTWMINDIAMPSLNSIRSESINFTEFYAPKYLWAATFNSENIVNTGMVSPTNSSKLSYFTNTEYPYSMPNLFAKEGYTVNSFHRSNETIYSRGEAHENWGYENYFSGGEMKLSNYDMDSYLMEAYDLFVPDEKFMSFIITYTGHGPYSADHEAVKLYESEIRAALPEDAEDEYVYALCYARETDMFIKKLFERLEADKKLDDTVVVFYTDHYDHYITDDNILKKYKNASNEDMLNHVPFFIYSSDTEPMEIDKTVATYDILPTIVNLFDLDTDGRYYIGNDAFSENGGYVFFLSGSWYDKNTYFDIYTSEVDDKARKRTEEINKRLNASWDSIKIDYFSGK